MISPIRITELLYDVNQARGAAAAAGRSPESREYVRPEVSVAEPSLAYFACFN
jgi:hypothetical protein